MEGEGEEAFRSIQIRFDLNEYMKICLSDIFFHIFNEMTKEGVYVWTSKEQEFQI